MERRNQAKRQKKKREESARIIRLVETSYLLDPRVIRQKQEENARKEKIKQERRDAIRKAQEEEQARVDAERKRQEEEAKRLQEEANQKKREKDRGKKAVQKQRQQLRKLCSEASVSTEDVEAVCVKFGSDLTALTDLCTVLTGLAGNSPKIVETIKDTLMTAEQKEQAASAAAAKAAVEAAAKAAAEAEAKLEKSAEWTPDEITLLGKALIRFPVGTANRWDAVSNFMGNKRTSKEIIARLKAIKERDLSNKNPETRELEDSFSRWQRTKKDVDVGSEKSERYEAPGTPSEKAAAKAAAAPAAAPETPAASPKKVAAATTSAAAAAAAAPTAAPTDDWTADQQKSLEAALKQFPSTLTDRWDKIAEAVEGKTRKDCIARFKYLVSMVKGGPAKK